MKTIQCPSPQDLCEFDLGKLISERREQIEEHLDQCHECAAALESLAEHSDDLLECLREPVPRDCIAEDSEVRRLVEAAAAIHDTSLAAQAETQDAKGRRRKPTVDQLITQVLAPAQADDELGRLGGYRVLEVLGVGGMGAVFQAEDVALQRRVALKVMLPHVASAHDTAGERFLREARATAAVHHDHVVTIFQVGEDRDVPFLAMELLEGQSLADRLRSERKIPLDEALRIARETAQGLSAAHAKGLTHRDIKPDNIWLEAGTGRVKILDFGLARSADEQLDLTQTGAVVGTPSYLAPEQAMGRPADARSDLFSLGVVLYQMLTGRKPFQRDNLLATLRAIDSETPPAPSTLDDDIPAALSDLVARLLAKEPAQRFASATELLAALRSIDTDSPVPLTLPAQRKVPPRRSTLIATAAAAALILLAGVIITVRDKNGNILARIFAPDDSTATTEPGNVDGVDTNKVIDNSAAKPVRPNSDAEASKDHLPPMSPSALAQRPAKLVAKDGEPVQSWTVLPVGVQDGSASALSIDGQLLATFGGDGAVRVWDVEKKSLHKVLIGHAAGPCSPAMKPDDRSDWSYHQTNSRRFGPIAWRTTADGKSSWLATASRDGSVRVWDIEKGTTVWKDARDGDLINMLAWSPDGTKLAVGYDDGQVRTWEADGGKELKSLSLAEGPPFSLGWSPDSQRLAVHVSSVNSAIGAVLVWNPDTGDKRRLECPGVIAPLGNNNVWCGLSAMRWSPDGKQLAFKGSDCLLIHDTTNWQQAQRLTSGLKDNHLVQDFDWSPDGTSVLVSWNGQLQLHDLKSDKATAVPLKDKQMAVQIEWAPRSTRVALLNGDGIHSTYSDILNTQTMDIRRLQHGGDHVHEFSSDGTRLLAGTAHFPSVFELEADKAAFWQPMHQPGLSQQEVVTKGLENGFEVSPNGQQLAVDQGSLRIHSSDGRLQSSFLLLNFSEPFIFGTNGHFWSNDQSQGPFWATKGSVPHTLVYVVQTANGQKTLTPVEFANRYGWRNDPSQVRLK